MAAALGLNFVGHTEAERSLPEPSLKAAEAAAPDRRLRLFFFSSPSLSVCVLTVAAVKNNWTFLTAAPRP